MRNNRKNRLVALALFMIMSVGFLLRIDVWLDRQKFAGDEGIQLLTASHLVRYGIWPQSGEISGLDANNTFLFHNGVTGLLLQTLIYLAGLMTPTGYSFWFVVISTAWIGLLYVIGKNVFSLRAGLLAALFGALSPTMVWLSDWTSQPMMCVYGFTLGLALLTTAYTNKRLGWWYGGMFVSLVSIQLYPPAWLLFPIILGFHGYVWRKIYSSVSGMRMILYTGLLLGVAWFPTWAMELTSYANIPVLMGYLNRGKEFAATADRIPDYFLGERLVRTLSVFVEYLTPFSERWTPQFWVGLLSLVGFIIFWLPISQWFKRLLPFLVIMLYSIMALNVSTLDRATYLYPLLPVWVLGLAGLMDSVLGILDTYTHRMVWIVVVLMIAVLMSQCRWPGPDTPVLSLRRIQQAVSFIESERERLQIPLDKIDLYVITQNDRWNWEATMYWYLLERLTGTKLAAIDPPSSKAIRESRMPVSLFYLICEQTYVTYGDEALPNTINCQQQYFSIFKQKTQLKLLNTFSGDTIMVYVYAK